MAGRQDPRNLAFEFLSSDLQGMNRKVSDADIRSLLELRWKSDISGTVSGLVFDPTQGSFVELRRMLIYWAGRWPNDLPAQVGRLTSAVYSLDDILYTNPQDPVSRELFDNMAYRTFVDRFNIRRRGPKCINKSCGKNNTSYLTYQTRGADEQATSKIRCWDCGQSWDAI